MFFDLADFVATIWSTREVLITFNNDVEMDLELDHFLVKCPMFFKISSPDEEVKPLSRKKLLKLIMAERDLKCLIVPFRNTPILSHQKDRWKVAYVEHFLD